MITPSYNLTAARLGACIDRISQSLAEAKRALAAAEERNREAIALLASESDWTAQDAIYADPTYVADFKRMVEWHQSRLDHHAAVYLEVHGNAFLGEAA